MRSIATTAVLSLCLASSLPPNAFAVRLPWASDSAAQPPAAPMGALVKGPGASLGLELGKDGLLFKRWDPAAGQASLEALDAPSAARVVAYLAKVPAGRAAETHAQALEQYLGAQAGSLGGLAFEAGADGKRVLSALGRNLLVDILTAKDGAAFKDEPAKPQPGAAAAALSIKGFDWTRMDAEKMRALSTDFAVDEERQTVRLLVSAKRSAKTDRLSVDAGEQDAVLTETGVDEAAVRESGASVVRAMDNLVVLEVPLAKAGALGRSLQQEGLQSRPARAFRAPDSSRQGGAGAPPQGGLEAFDAGGAFKPLNDASRDMLGADKLWQAGMDGKGALVGVIDTGLDLNHPDFQKSVKAFFDLTGEGHSDVEGHGTHVAGSIAGSGEASGGKYKGMAPGAKLAVFKVFDSKGNTSEDTILAAMKHAAAIGVQVINMSLGGPGDPEADPLAQMANRLVVKNNILVVTAAGNSGPEAGSIGAPGDAEYALSVTGVDKQGNYPFYTSRGPITDSKGRVFEKPDLSAVAGGVDLGGAKLVADGGGASKNGLAAAGGAGGLAAPKCIYTPGVISARSSDDPDTSCAVPGNPAYRYMSGTSMAAPMAAGIAADVVGYLEAKGVAYQATEVKAAMMETAKDMGQQPEVQGAGLINGGRLAQAVQSRAAMGLPVGNIAYMLALRLTSAQRAKLASSAQYAMTSAGIWDAKNGRLVNDDLQLRRLTSDLEALTPPVMAQVEASPVQL